MSAYNLTTCDVSAGQHIHMCMVQLYILRALRTKCKAVFIKHCSYQVSPWDVWTWSLSIYRSWAGRLLGKSQCLSRRTEKTKLPPATGDTSYHCHPSVPAMGNMLLVESYQYPTISLKGLWQLWLHLNRGEYISGLKTIIGDNSVGDGLPLLAMCTAGPRVA